MSVAKATEGLSIYERYGGFETFHRCIHGLYKELFDHPEIAYHFVGVDIERLSKLQAQFLCEAIGGPKMYEGRAIRPVHSIMGVTVFQYKEVASHFRRVFEEEGLLPEDVEFIMNFVLSKEKDIVTKSSSWIDEVMSPLYRLKEFISRVIRGD